MTPGTVVVLDEPTSNVDAATNVVVEGVVQDQFAGNTVVTVAHRLSTVVGCGLVVVLDRGAVVELGRPGEVYKRREAFWGLCRAHGVRPGGL